MTISTKTIIISKEEAFSYNHYQMMALEKLADMTGRTLVIEHK